MVATIGCRIPKEYFVTKGKGESDLAVHAGSFHLALRDAGIEMCNIMQYSSILPKIAIEIPKPDELVHGSVMETIMAVSHARKGHVAVAGVMYGWLMDRITGSRYGGLVCEHTGHDPVDVERRLWSSIGELYENGYQEKFSLESVAPILQSLEVEKSNGTALVALCFTSYEIPVLSTLEAPGIDFRVSQASGCRATGSSGCTKSYNQTATC